MPLPNKQLISYEEFLKLQEVHEGKLEYFNGKVFYMTPTTIKHNSIVGNIAFELKRYFKGSKCNVFTEQVAIETGTQNGNFLPDVFVMCEDAKTKGERFITPPKIIFEVVSRSNNAMIKNDYYTKLKAYADFGVIEYCIVEQDGRIAQYRLLEDEDGTKYYVLEDTMKRNDIYKSIVFPELNIDLKDIF